MSQPEVSIEIRNPVWSKIERGSGLLKPALSFEKVVTKKGPDGIYHETKREPLYKNGNFFTGFLPRVREFCTKTGINLITRGSVEILEPEVEPNLANLTLRPYQKRLVEAIIEKQRGVILAATAAGKTVIIMGVASCFPSSKILILCHTKAILTQTYERLLKEGFKDVVVVGGTAGNKEFRGHQIVIGMRQTFANVDPNEYVDYFDILFVDETHHVSDAYGQYGTILSYSLAPMRVGFTGSMEETPEALLALEGLIGPVIGTFTDEEGVQLGFLSELDLILVPVPYNDNIGAIWDYNELYTAAIVKNRVRNKTILQIGESEMGQGCSCLILVVREEHGLFLAEMARDVFDINVPFVWGKTDDETRERVKKYLSSKEIKVVISSSIWREGVDMPSLDSVVLGAPHRKWLPTIQGIGRGRRKEGEKSVVRVYDMLDPYGKLAEQTVSRLHLYVEKGWLNRREKP